MPLSLSSTRTKMALLARPAARILRLRPALVPQSRVACLSTTVPRRNATPGWEQLIGGRAGVERRRAEFQNRYRDALEAKARAEGISVEELKRRALDEAEKKQKKATRTRTTTTGGDVMGGGQGTAAMGGPVEAGSMDTRKTAKELEQGAQAAEVVKPLPSAAAESPSSQSEPRQPLAPKKSDSPVKVGVLFHAGTPRFGGGSRLTNPCGMSSP